MELYRRVNEIGRGGGRGGDGVGEGCKSESKSSLSQQMLLR